MKNPYEIVKARRVTEKSRVLENLQNATGSLSLNRCKTPKAVFEVDMKKCVPHGRAYSYDCNLWETKEVKSGGVMII